MLPSAILSQVQYNVFGEATPPGSITARAQYAITRALNKLMADRLWWFQITEVALNTIANTASYALPTDYRSSLGMIYQNGTEVYRLSRLTSEEMLGQITTGKPRNYGIEGLNALIYPTPDAIYPLKHTYYKSFTIVFGGTEVENAPTTYAYDFLIAQGTAELALMYDYQTKAQNFTEAAEEALDDLRVMHHNMRTGDLKAPRYQDV